MKWVLIGIGVILFAPLILKILWWLFKTALNILSWLLWPIAIVTIFVGILILINGNIAAGIIVILLGGLVTAPIGIIKKKPDEEAWWEDQDVD